LAKLWLISYKLTEILPQIFIASLYDAKEFLLSSISTLGLVSGDGLAFKFFFKKNANFNER